MLHKPRKIPVASLTVAISLLFGLSITYRGPFVTQACGDILQGPATPKQIVEAYCRASFDGAFMNPEGYAHSGIGRYIIPNEGQDSWDMVVIINNYKILEPSQGQDKAEVPVRYDILGQEKGGVDFHSERKSERYVFHLKKINGAWKLLDPLGLPIHVSVNAEIRHLKFLLKSQKETHPEVPRLIREIQRLKSRK